jgi:UDP-N-acetyl-D-glucosamine dehydrogenase
MGVAYKRDIDDLRESPALDVMHLLRRRSARVTYSDPYIGRIGEGLDLCAEPVETAYGADCVVIITDHASFDYRSLVEKAALIVDSRNALKGFKSDNIVRL